MWRGSKRVRICKSRREVSEVPNPAGTLILDLYPTELWETRFLLCKTPRYGLNYVHLKFIQTAEKRRKATGKGEKERYTHLNADFQRIAGRDKNVFLSEQWKEIKENNRMGKTRDLFKKIRDTEGTFHAKMGAIKDRKYMDLT